MRTGIIYKSTNIVSEKSYIGQTINGLKRRMLGHYKSAKKSNSHFHNAIKKYKKEDWKWEILYDKIPTDQLDIAEICSIYLHDTYYNGYNSTEGGDINPTKNPEVRKKISESTKGRIPWNKGKEHSRETKSKISAKNKGKRRSKKFKQRMSKLHTGKKHSQKTKNKIRNSAIGRKHSDKSKEKMSRSQAGLHVGEKNSFFGKKHSKETKLKISKAKIGKCDGEKNPFFGKKHSKETKLKISKAKIGISHGHSEETKLKIGKSRSKKYEIKKPDGSIEIIINLSKYCRVNCLNNGAMVAVSMGKRKTHKGYRCRKINDAED